MSYTLWSVTSDPQHPLDGRLFLDYAEALREAETYDTNLVAIVVDLRTTRVVREEGDDV